MPSYSMADIVNDPDFAQLLPGAIARDSGSFVLGKWKSNTTLVDFYGIVQPAKSKDIEMIPEGDRVNGAQMFHSSSPIYETHGQLGYGEGQYGDGGYGGTNPPSGISDVIYWHLQPYRIMYVWPWIDFGYYKAIGVRMSGK
jgi:hypothetical protein